jgi:hypothetical protein
MDDPLCLYPALIASLTAFSQSEPSALKTPRPSAGKSVPELSLIVDSMVNADILIEYNRVIRGRGYLLLHLVDLMS